MWLVYLLQNAFCAAPVHVCKAHLQVGNPRYLLPGMPMQGLVKSVWQMRKQPVRNWLNLPA